MPRLRICGPPTVREASASARQLVRERGLHRLGVGQPGAEPQRAVLARPAAQLGHLVQVQERVGPAAVEVELDHHVRAALDRHGVRLLGLQAQRLVERAGRQDVHGGKGTSAGASWKSCTRGYRGRSRPRSTTRGGARRRARRPRRPRRSRALGLHARVARRRRRDRRRLRRRARRLRGRRDARRVGPLRRARASSTRTCTSSRRSCSSTSSRGSCCRSGRPRSSSTRTRSRTCSAPTACTGCSTPAGSLPLDVFFMASSCVPASEFESPRRPFSAGDLEGLLRRRRVIGLAEMMNFPGVVSGDPHELEKLRPAGRRARRRPRAGRARQGAERLRGRRHLLRPRGLHDRRGPRAAARGHVAPDPRGARRRATSRRCCRSRRSSARTGSRSAPTTASPSTSPRTATSTRWCATPSPPGSRPRTRS